MRCYVGAVREPPLRVEGITTAPHNHSCEGRNPSLGVSPLDAPLTWFDKLTMNGHGCSARPEHVEGHERNQAGFSHVTDVYCASQTCGKLIG